MKNLKLAPVTIVTMFFALLQIDIAIAADTLPVHSPESVIYLTKNTNHNQVHYGVTLDDQCRPAADDPVYAYWQMLEKGKDARAKLMFWEQPGYGVRQPDSINESAAGGNFEFFIRGVPEQKIRMESFTLPDGSCGARATTEIAGKESIIQRIDIYVSGWANIHKVEIFGIDPVTFHQVQEITFEEK